MKTPKKEVSDDHFKALGLLVVAFSELEFWMKGFANLMINPWGKTAEIVTSDMPVKALLEKLMSLYRHLENDPERVKTFETLLGQIRDCISARNDMIHSVWFFIPPLFGDTDPLRTKTRAKFKGYEVEQREIKISEIDGLTSRIRQASHELLRMTFEWQIEHDGPKVTTPGEPEEDTE